MFWHFTSRTKSSKEVFFYLSKVFCKINNIEKQVCLGILTSNHKYCQNRRLRSINILPNNLISKPDSIYAFITSIISLIILTYLCLFEISFLHSLFHIFCSSSESFVHYFNTIYINLYIVLLVLYIILTQV